MSTATANTDKVARTRRRLRQFGLRSVLIVMTVSAAVMAVYGGHIRRSVRYEHALAEISRRGGTVLVHDEGAYVFFHDDGGPWWGGEQRAVAASLDHQLWAQPRFDSQPALLPFTDDDVSLLLSFPKPYELDLRGTQVTAAGAGRLLKRWPQLRLAYGDSQVVNWSHNPHEPWVCGTFLEELEALPPEGP